MTKRQRRFEDLKQTLRRLESILEIALLSYIYYYVWRTCYEVASFPTYYGRGKYLLMLVYALLAMFLFHYCDSFKFGHRRGQDIMIAQWISLFIVNSLTYLQLCLLAECIVTVIPMLILMAIDIVVSAGCAFIFTRIYRHFHKPRNMLLIYGSDNAIDLKFKMDTRVDKYRVEHLISIDAGLDAVLKEIDNYKSVVINDVHSNERNEIIKYCYDRNIRAYITPKISDIMCRGADDVCLFDTPLLLIRSGGLSVSQRFIKRFLDLLLSLIALIVLSPLMIIVSIAIKLEDGGPVFYKQKRVTRDGREFNILKFRSMIQNAEKDGISVPATERDPRITKIGAITRAMRIDELPQLINILKGDMSIVGPRPERVEHVEMYTKEIPEFVFRTKVKGGLTGYAQIYGKYNTSAYDKLRLDMMYIENYSLMLDIKLVLMTLQILVKKESTEGFDKADELESKRNAILSGSIGNSARNEHAADDTGDAMARK